MGKFIHCVQYYYILKMEFISQIKIINYNYNAHLIYHCCSYFFIHIINKFVYYLLSMFDNKFIKM